MKPGLVPVVAPWAVSRLVTNLSCESSKRHWGRSVSVLLLAHAETDWMLNLRLRCHLLHLFKRTEPETKRKLLSERFFGSPQSTIFRVDLGQPEAAPTVFRDTVVGGLNKDEFETRQVFVPSKDGTKIPMFVGESGTADVC